MQVFTKKVNSGSSRLVITTIRDVSQMLELEKEKNISQIKTIAFSSAAHEFRNPLNGIVNSLDLLEDMIDKTRGL